MADIRCPMCGRPNPPDLDVCRFCQARLKPLVVSPFAGDGEPIKPGQTPTPRKTGDLEPDLPDWLRDLRGKETEEAPESAAQNDLPDWLGEEPEEPSASTKASPGGASDWLRDLRGGEEKEPQAPEQGASLPDWPPGETEEAADAGESSLGDSSDWWSRISSESPSTVESAPEDVSKDAAGAGPAGSFFAETQPQEPPVGKKEEEEELPDWLAALSSDDFLGYTSKPEQEVPPSKPPAPPETSPGFEEGKDPDWLQRVRSRQQADSQPSKDIFLPDEEQSEGAEVFSSQPPARPTEERDLPDWLSRLAPPEPVAEEPAESTPDWLTQPEAERTPEPLTPGDSVPDWLSRLGAQDQEDIRWPDSSETAEQQVTPSAGEESTPEWLSKLEAGSPDQAASGVPAFVFDDAGELPAGSEEERGKPPAESNLEEASLPSLSTLPDWIAQVSEEGESEEGAPAEQVEPGLAPAQLPNWLEAMRPVETAAPMAPAGEDLGTQVEKVGPLAGLHGVIPAEPVIGHLRKPPAYSVKLQVSESQHRNTVLLQKLLELEGQAKPLPSRPAFTSQAVLRLVIAVALFLAVLVPLWLNSQGMPLPDPAYVPDGIIETNALINTLSNNEPVLVAVDYEPGLSAEMDALAFPIVNGIASRGASLALVSTNSTGPMLAERLMGWLNLSRGANRISYANLGYIAGGPAGLWSFAQSPRQILPYDLGGSTQPARADLWTNGPLAGVQSVADFAMLLVITENADTARDWIEQVQPFMQSGNVPVLMVVSAQAEPMIRPYFEGSSGQVHGLVAGLNGGAAFERLTGQAGPARSYWDAFGAGLLVAESLILVGGLINIVLVLLAPRKGTEVEGMQ